MTPYEQDARQELTEAVTMALYFAVLLVSAGVSAVIARHKGRSGEAFFLWGLIFGVFAIVYAVFAQPGNTEKRSTLAGGARVERG